MDIYCNLEQIARARRTGLLGSDAYMFLRQTGNSNINHGLMGWVSDLFSLLISLLLDADISLSSASYTASILHII